MRGYQVTTVWGIPIRIHISLLVVLPIFAWLIGNGVQLEVYAALVNALAGTNIDAAALQGGTLPWIIGSVAAVGLFVSVTLHELGHAYVALRYDLEVESITLWILGGLASLGQIPKEWKKEFWIALAGPVVSVLVGVGCLVAVAVLPELNQPTTFVVGWIGATNILLAVFNMLPAFPMDGGRILRALLARNRPYAKATQLAGRIGTGFALLFAVVGVLQFSPMLLILAVFIYGAASSESRAVLLGELLEGVTVGDLTGDRGEGVPASTSVTEMVDRMFADRQSTFVVTQGGEPVGVVTVADFKRLTPEERDTTTVGDLMTTELPTLDETTPAFDGLVALDSGRASAAFVDGPGGRRVVSRTDFAEALEMRRLLGTRGPF